LRANKIDVAKLEETSSSDRAQDLRKVASLVIIRDVFMKPNGDGDSLAGRSRKNPDPYTGASSIFAMSEGNPRWFIGLINEMLSARRGSGPIPRAVQASSARKASHAFRMRLRLIASGDVTIKIMSALGVIDMIGEALSQRALRDDFQPEYFGSFTVDADTPPELQTIIGIALNAGALVYVPDADSEGVIASPRGKRFRLAYLLAPHYKLPLLLGKSLSLRHLSARSSGQESFMMEVKE
jgi:hypothetical protein